MESLDIKLQCQSCGNDFDEEYSGTNLDGTLSLDYCAYCYRNGKFVDELSLNQLVNSVIVDHQMLGLSREKAYNDAYNYFKDLKRWKDDE